MFDRINDEANELARKFLEEMEETTAEQLGLDSRACWQMWKGDDCVAIRKSDKGRFDYYGGGEYVNKDCVAALGDYVFYSAEDSRVAGWLGMDEEEVDPMDDFNYTGSRHHY